MKPILVSLLAGLAGVSALAKDITEVLVTARYRDRDFGTMNYACCHGRAGFDRSTESIAQAR